MAIKFHVRWREELVASSDEGALVLELTMGKWHMYFLMQKRWEGQVPSWAKAQWDEYKSASEAWCQREKIPFSMVDNALV